MNVGNKIKEKVKQRGLTSDEFAHKIGKHPRYVYQLYKRKHINTELLTLIAEVLDEEVEYFLQNKEELPNTNNDMRKKYNDDYKDRLIQLLEEKVEYLTSENERLKSGDDKQKAKVG